MATPLTYTPKRLFDPLLVPAATTLIHTSPTGQAGTQLYSLDVVSAQLLAVTITLWLVPSGQSPGNAYLAVHGYAVPTDGGNYALLPGTMLFLNAGDTLHARASAANRVVLHGSGVELT